MFTLGSILTQENKKRDVQSHPLHSSMHFWVVGLKRRKKKAFTCKNLPDWVPTYVSSISWESVYTIFTQLSCNQNYRGLENKYLLEQQIFQMIPADISELRYYLSQEGRCFQKKGLIECSISNHPQASQCFWCARRCWWCNECTRVKPTSAARGGGEAILGTLLINDMKKSCFCSCQKGTKMWKIGTNILWMSIAGGVRTQCANI